MTVLNLCQKHDFSDFVLYLQASGTRKDLMLHVNYLVTSRNAPHISTLPSGLAVFTVEIAVLLLQELRGDKGSLSSPLATWPSSPHTTTHLHGRGAQTQREGGL